MNVSIGVSNRHIHLTKEDLMILCGTTTLEETKPLRQPGQYAASLQVTIQTEKATIDKVRVLGPTRPYTQVEVTKTDAYKLGINPPVRESGDLNGASLITIVGPCGKVTKECAIIASRHIHIDKETREKLGLTNVTTVSVKVLGEKGGVLENVMIKESAPAYFEMHVDTDDANAHLITCNDDGIILIQE